MPQIGFSLQNLKSHHLKQIFLGSAYRPSVSLQVLAEEGDQLLCTSSTVMDKVGKFLDPDENFVMSQKGVTSNHKGPQDDL